MLTPHQRFPLGNAPFDKGLVVECVVVNISFIENDQALKGF